ncbi:glycosyltransferase family 2 protein [Mucilaginibacter flavidus]|uniref:glycosyltransferase family 2 protein n=1 Tax=Mucilaginibacter flavidus TaxID=2949309 RepID=UPI002092A1B8|nr:glycosyltransferase family 2 protein [Mucilaginibacter flavidus]MCO5947664.1 glycosyltransferase [Mucilaginibacter flavidus]
MDNIVSQPLVSVIMPVYNCEQFIGNAVESILKQTLNDFELIIIDDFSNDQTVVIVESYNDCRIRIFKKSENTGYIASLNRGLEMAQGKYIARMDGDDISDLKRFEKQVYYLDNNPDIAGCGTWYRILGTDRIIKNPVAPDDVKIALLDYCALGHPTVMIREQFLKKGKFAYDPSFYPAEDYELWTRIVASGKLSNIPEVLLSYRMHPNQVSATAQQIQVAKSYQCKMKMLRYLVDPASAEDLKNIRLLVTTQVIGDADRLGEMVGWLSKLETINARSEFYEDSKFKIYVKEKKAGIVRTYYLHNTVYNLGVLKQFNKNFCQYFTLNELIRFTLKCTLPWK